MIAFGPVPSRRLGRSLGINNIPPKVCTYSCAYCQVGRTHNLEVERQAFFRPELIFKEVKEKVDTVLKAGLSIDYLTFVPDGEPTLDINLGKEAQMLKALGIKIAVISNASLIWDESVREDLAKADWVSLKVDAVDEKAWRRINRPHRAIKLEKILDGIQSFNQSFEGKLVTETMLLRGVNDGDVSMELIADFLATVRPAIAYISIPTRPPAESWAWPPSEESINRAFLIFRSRLDQAELLVGYEGDAFACTGDAAHDLLSITAVHPMREEAVRRLLDQAGESWAVVGDLLEKGLLVEAEYEGMKYYLHRPKRESYL